jgi:hypothetical protein
LLKNRRTLSRTSPDAKERRVVTAYGGTAVRRRQSTFVLLKALSKNTQRENVLRTARGIAAQ